MSDAPQELAGVESLGGTAARAVDKSLETAGFVGALLVLATVCAVLLWRFIGREAFDKITEASRNAANLASDTKQSTANAAASAECSKEATGNALHASEILERMGKQQEERDRRIEDLLRRLDQ